MMRNESMITRGVNEILGATRINIVLHDLVQEVLLRLWIETLGARDRDNLVIEIHPVLPLFEQSRVLLKLIANGSSPAPHHVTPNPMGLGAKLAVDVLHQRTKAWLLPAHRFDYHVPEPHRGA